MPTLALISNAGDKHARDKHAGKCYMAITLRQMTCAREIWIEEKTVLSEGLLEYSIHALHMFFDVGCF